MAAPKKKPVKKTTAKKSATKKVAKTVSKTTAKKTATKKTAVKKVATKKTATKKAATKKPNAKSVAEKKVSKIKTVEKKPAKKVLLRKPKKEVPIKIEKVNINEKTLQKLKELLLMERERNLFQSEELAQEAVDLITDREAGDTQFDEESGEGDSVAVERERTLFLSAEAQNTVNQIDRALERMKKKTYGSCQKCGKRIGIPRLEALPWAEVCIDCKAKSERRF